MFSSVAVERTSGRLSIIVDANVPNAVCDVASEFDISESVVITVASAIFCLCSSDVAVDCNSGEFIAKFVISDNDVAALKTSAGVN